MFSVFDPSCEAIRQFFSVTYPKKNSQIFEALFSGAPVQKVAGSANDHESTTFADTIARRLSRSLAPLRVYRLEQVDLAKGVPGCPAWKAGSTGNPRSAAVVLNYTHPRFSSAYRMSRMSESF